MALNVPTVEEFLARFPSFEGQSSIIALLLVEAQRYVQDTWNVDDQKTALLYLTAHLLVTETSAGGAMNSGIVTSESFGPMSRSYAVNQNATRWELSEYGRRFADIMRRNTGGRGIVVVGGVFDGQQVI